MKKLIALGLLSWNIAAAAQTDSVQISNIVEKYVRSFYETKPEWFQESVHSGLAKRTVKDFHGAGDYLKDGSFEEMILLAKVFDAKEDRYGKDAKAEVSIYDIESNFASAKVEAEGWFDFVHLAKLNGEWKIVNILWGMQAKNPKP